MSNRSSYEGDPFLYTGGDPPVPGMDCLQLRHQPAGPFHYLISEQAKSLVALQELQHEVGALLEFRDLVMATFPDLRSKLAASTPSTMTSHHHLLHHPHQHHQSNIPVSIRPGDWTPGVRVRKKIGSKEEGRGGRKVGEVAVQDSGFSTETSSKETHSASSSSAVLPSSSAPGPTENDEVEDELWNLLDIIHRKGTRLKDEAEALQGTLRHQGDLRKEDDRSFRQTLFNSSSVDDVRQLRQERDSLIDRLAEMEAEVLAGRVHTSRLQEDLENLLSTKQDLEEQLKAVVTQRGEVNSRIHDLHLQFVKSGAGVADRDEPGGRRPTDRRDPPSSICSSQRAGREAPSEIDAALGDELPRVGAPDGRKVAAILRERDPLVLQKHLLTTTVRNQVLREQLDSAAGLEIGLRDKLDKAREENEDLRFQLEDRNIELEGTRARVRMLESLAPPPLRPHPTSPDIIPALESGGARPPTPSTRPEVSTASMRAMQPLDFDSLRAADRSSGTESAHNESAEREKKSRRPSKIPLKSYTAPKPPAGKHSPAPGTRSRSGDSPHRSHSTQSWRTNKSEGNSLNGPPKLTASLPKSRNSSLVTAKDSLSSKLRNSDSLMKLSHAAPDSPKPSRNSFKTAPVGFNGFKASAPAVNSFKTGSGAVVKKTAGMPVKKDSSAIGDKIVNSNSSKEKSQSPWNNSSYSSEPEDLAYPDSLDQSIGSARQSITDSTGSRFQTANTFLWTVGSQRAAKVEYYDSIDTNMASSLFHNGEELAECDSLERHLSDFSDRK